MLALLHDRNGPRRLTRGVALSALGVLAIALAASYSDGWTPWSAMASLLALAALPLTRVSPLRFRPRDVSLTLRPGDVYVHAGLRSFHLRAAEITGATVSRHGAGCALTLSLSTRAGMPVTLVFAKDSEADEVRAALGLGHGGRGETSWLTEWEPTATVLAWLTTATLALGALFAANGGDSSSASSVLAVVCALAGVFGLLLTWAASPAVKAGTGRRVALRPEGVYLPVPSGQCFSSYADLGRVDPADGALVFQIADNPFVLVRSRALPATEIELIASHLVSAKRRALGEGPLPVDVRARLRSLERGDAPVAAWLARLEGVALSGGYRGGALEADDLRVALGDPDLDVELRVAAARVLARVDPEVRTRVADLAHTAPNASRARALRAAMGDVDDLTSALVELEAHEPRRARLPSE